LRQADDDKARNSAGAARVASTMASTCDHQLLPAVLELEKDVLTILNASGAEEQLKVDATRLDQLCAPTLSSVCRDGLIEHSVGNLFGVCWVADTKATKGDACLEGGISRHG
jgi:hypothetical protein